MSGLAGLTESELVGAKYNDYNTVHRASLLAVQHHANRTASSEVAPPLTRPPANPQAVDLRT